MSNTKQRCSHEISFTCIPYRFAATFMRSLIQMKNSGKCVKKTKMMTKLIFLLKFLHRKIAAITIELVSKLISSLTQSWIRYRPEILWNYFMTIKNVANMSKTERQIRKKKFFLKAFFFHLNLCLSLDSRYLVFGCLVNALMRSVDTKDISQGKLQKMAWCQDRTIQGGD